MLQKLAVIGLCLGALLPGYAVAAPKAAPSVSASKSTLNLENTKKALESGDEERALAALDEIELSGDRRAAPLVDALLARGASSKLLLRAMGVAGVLGKEASSTALAPYVKHRAPEVRRAAAQSLAHTKGSVAVHALREALRGSDPALRGTAAEASVHSARKKPCPICSSCCRKTYPRRPARSAFCAATPSASASWAARQVALRRHGERLFAAALAHEQRCPGRREAATDRAVCGAWPRKNRTPSCPPPSPPTRRTAIPRSSRRSTPPCTVTPSRAPSHERARPLLLTATRAVRRRLRRVQRELDQELQHRVAERQRPIDRRRRATLARLAAGAERAPRRRAERRGLGRRHARRQIALVARGAPQQRADHRGATW